MPPGKRALGGIFGKMLDPLLKVAKKSKKYAGDAAAAARRSLPSGRAVPGGAPPARGLPGGAPGGRGLPGGQPLRNSPTDALSRADYPQLAPNKAGQLESQALPGARPARPAQYADPNGPRMRDEDMLGTFQGDVRYEPMRAGETYYRSVGDGSRPASNCWTTEPPPTNDYLRSDLAVRNEWNGNQGVVAYTPTQDIPAWRGEAGPQAATGPTPGGSPTQYLNGGGEQVTINHGRDYSDIPGSDLRPNPDGTYPQWSIGRSAWA